MQTLIRSSLLTSRRMITAPKMAAKSLNMTRNFVSANLRLAPFLRKVENLLQAKGFEKFTKKAPTQKQVKNISNKPGGGGNGGGNEEGPNIPIGKIGVFLFGAVLLTLFIENTAVASMEHNLVNWKMFEQHLLAPGRVREVHVTQEGIVNILLKEPFDLKAHIKALEEQNESPIDDVLTGDVSTPISEVKADTPVLATTTSVPSPPKSDTPTTNATTPASETLTEEEKEEKEDKSQLEKLRMNANSHYTMRIVSAENFEERLERLQHELGIKRDDFVPVTLARPPSKAMEFISGLMFFVMVTGLLILGLSYVARKSRGGLGGNMFGIKKDIAKRFNQENVKTTFADVAGCDEAKREIMEFVEFLKDGSRFLKLGAKIPRGALLTGPPGTGKTLLARATAGEAGVPFFSVSGSDFVEMFVGLGSSRVRELFATAKKNAPCIVFIDEIDAIGRQRSGGNRASGANDERENTLNQLLVEMDGFESTAQVVVLAGTNRADILDKALLRPGRFDRQIVVDKPDIRGRKDIFMVHLKPIVIAGEIESFASRLAGLTPGFTGADIANICNEAAMVAARHHKDVVDMTDFEKAVDRVIAGQETKKIMSPEEKKTIAYHEAGHAVAGWFLEHADPLMKVTIVPRGSGALGFAQYLPKEVYLRTKDQLMDIMTMALAGRASEQVNFGVVTTGASDDLKRVTQIAYQMIQVFGMNDSIGQLSFPKEDSGFGFSDRMYSEETAEKMDNEVRKLVTEVYERALNLMKSKHDQVNALAQLLMDRETITNYDVSQLLGARPFTPSKEYADFLHHGWSNPKASVEQTENEVASEATESSDKDNSTVSDGSDNSNSNSEAAQDSTKNEESVGGVDEKKTL